MSCELIVDVDVPYRGDKIVMNTFQNPGSPWIVELTKTKYILDSLNSGFPPIAGAQVVIFEPDGTSFPLSGTAGYYFSNRVPEEGKTYRITAKASGFQEVEAEMTIPKAIKIMEIKWDSSSVRKVDPSAPFYDQYYSNSTIPFTLKFSDPPHEKNYYSIVVDYWYVRKYTDPQTQMERADTLLGSARTWITDRALVDEDDRKSRFSDFAFDGTTYAVAATTQFYFLDPRNVVYKFDVKLYSVSEEYFNYEESRELFNQVEGDPFAQPVQIYTNVKNGLGIFGGFSLDQRSYGRKYPE